MINTLKHDLVFQSTAKKLCINMQKNLRLTSKVRIQIIGSRPTKLHKRDIRRKRPELCHLLVKSRKRFSACLR